MQSWRNSFPCCKGMFKTKQGCWSSKRSSWTHRSRSPDWHQGFPRTYFQAGWSLCSSKTGLEEPILPTSSGTKTSCKQAICERFAYPNAES
jgi:hypothetical protein